MTQPQTPAATPGDITVTGRGAAAQPPDLVSISIGVEARRASVPEAYSAAAAATGAILDRLKALGVGAEATATTGLNIRAESGWQEGRGNLVTGYLVTSTFTVRLRYQDRAQEIIAAAVDAGGDDVRLNGLAPELSDAGALSGRARAAAWADARARAEHYAALAGRTLGRVQSITEDESSAGGPGGPAPLLMRAAASTPLPLEAGEASVAASVRVTWELA